MKFSRLTGSTLLTALLSTCISMSVLSSRAHAQALTFDPTAEDSTAQTAQIVQWIQKNAAALKSTDREAASAARVALTQMLVSAPAPSGSFLEIYCRELATGLSSVLDARDKHARVNAALVIAKAAQASNGSTRLTPLAVKLVSDESSAVAIWGVDAAKHILPSIYRDANQARTDALLPAVMKLPAHFPKDPAVIQEVYDALSFGLVDRKFTTDNKAVVPLLAPTMIESLQKLVSARFAQYGPGVTPTEPAADGGAIRTLTTSSVWELASPAQRTVTAQLAVDLLARCKDQFGPGANDRKVLDPFREMIKQTGNGLALLSDKLQAAGPTPALEALRKAADDLRQRVGGATPNSDVVAKLDATIKATAAAIKGVNVPATPGPG